MKISGLSPFLDDSVEETTANILKCDFCFPDEYFEMISSDAKELLGTLLRLRGEDRANAEFCLGSPWLKVITLRINFCICVYIYIFFHSDNNLRISFKDIYKIIL